MDADRTVLFEAFTKVEGETRAFRVTRTDDGRVLFSRIDGGERIDLVRLPPEQAVALAVELLLADPEGLSKVAERIRDEDAAELAVRLMAPGAARALARKATAEGGVH